MKTNKIWGWLWIALGVLYFFVPLYATLEFSLHAQKGQLSLLAYVRVFRTRSSGAPSPSRWPWPC